MDHLAAPSVPECVGPYRIGGALGAGGAGSVHVAERDGERGFAVKLMLPQWATSEVMVRRFEREIETLGALDHPNVIRILDHGRLADGRLWYAMPRLQGTDLETLLATRGRFSVADLQLVMEAVCAALEAAHAHGVVHRDLKGSNVFIGHERPARITLLDFGAARIDVAAQGQGLTAAGTVVGTPMSMAPEQVVGLEADARTDVYAAGVLMFRLVTGRYPFDDRTPEETMLDHLTAMAPRPSTLAAVPHALDCVIMRCLEKRPQDRFASAAELGAALRDLGNSVASPDASALAIHVELLGDAAVVDRVGLDALEIAAERLMDAGFELAIGVGGSVLGVQNYDTPDQVDAARAVADALHRELVARLDPALEPSIVVHLGEAATLGTALVQERLGVLERMHESATAGVHLTSFAHAALAVA